MKAFAIDLFCGGGGLTHGLIKAGIPVKSGFDIDDECKYAYERNNKARFINKDIKNISADEVEKLYPKKAVKILVGCAPCQPFSTHTQKYKNRKNDGKWKLLYRFSRLINKIRPEIVSMENVVQLSKHKVFEDFVACLEKQGYKVSWKSVYCPDYGIPQNRRRLVLLASRLGEIEIIPPTHIPQEYKTVRDVIGKLHSIRHGKTYSKDPLHRAGALSPINLERIRSSIPGGTWRDWVRKLRAPCHRRKSGQTYSTVYSRMRWDKPSPTITTQFYRFGTGRFGHPKQDRAISLREGALLQTFPKSYDFIDPNCPKSLVKIGAHIGNAVPVKFGTIIGKSILKHLKGYYGEPI